MTIWDRIKRAWCERFHAGGYVCRDHLGRINWKCDTCGRLSNPVTHEDERRVVDAKIEEYRRNMAEQMPNMAAQKPMVTFVGSPQISKAREAQADLNAEYRDFLEALAPVTPHRYEASLIETWGTDCVVCGLPIWDGIHDTRKENLHAK
ncbi:hypothetical protein [Sulfitobacter sp. 915]|uniref:hypothetical protein n=1 Tax=Sulfitobacter sp. 915 TaxID=3368558 RepID=UPI0037466BD2